jgi:hypothetical protein
MVVFKKNMKFKEEEEEEDVSLLNVVYIASFDVFLQLRSPFLLAIYCL